MAFQGGSHAAPALLSAAQIKPVADLMYARIDKANNPLDVFKNGIINGAFDFNQRGQASYTTTLGTYCADRWVIGSETGGTGSLSFQTVAFSPGEANTESGYFGRVSLSGQTTAADGGRFSQAIESVRRFAGRRVVVRGLARRNAGAGNVAVELAQQCGTGGSAVTYKYVGTFTPAAVWTPFSFVVDVPSIAGKIIGTNDWLGLYFWLGAGSNFNARLNNLGLQSQTVDFADLEIKEVLPGFGDQFPGFERLPAGVELLRCLRYYEAYPFLLFQTPVGGYTGWTVTFKAPKRVVPSLVTTPNGSGVAGNNFAASAEAFTVQINSSASAYINGGGITASAEY